MSSSNKTKDWFKNQLVTHGVPLPASTAKKEEYQRLYEEQVLPRQSNTEFSSDDDTEETSHQETSARSSSVAHNSKPDTKTQNGTDGPLDKYTAWVARLSDRNLFSALRANGKEVGGIVDSTRMLYQNMLVSIMKEDPQKCHTEIKNYLTENVDAKNLWAESGVELNSVFNGHTNGNSENGFSDTDEDDTVETASRASRSSRASSKRMTPIRISAASPPTKESTPVHRTLAESTAKPKRGGTTSGRDDMLDEIDERENEDQGIITASSSRSHLMGDSLLYNRVSSPSTSMGFNKPYTMRKTVVETFETKRTQVYDGESEEVDSRSHPRTAPRKAGKAKALTAVKYILLFITIILVPCLAYYFLVVRPENSSNCEGSACSSDELDVLLQTLTEEGAAAQE